MTGKSSQPKGLGIVGLDQAMTTERLDELLALENGELGVRWEPENFLFELPQKWELSLALLGADRLWGFAFASRRSEEVAHLHRIIVAPERRGERWGSRLLERLMARVAAAGAKELRLHVAVANVGAQRFYRTHDFQVLETAPETGYLMGRAV